MKNDNRVLWTFLAKLLVALPACYGLWYWAVSLSGPAVWISARLLELLYPSVFAGIIPHGDDWIFATRLQDGGNAAAENTGIGIVVSPRQFDFGWPLLLALLTASPGSDRLTNIVIGSAGMVAVACWGITFLCAKGAELQFLGRLSPRFRTARLAAGGHRFELPIGHYHPPGFLSSPDLGVTRPLRDHPTGGIGSIQGERNRPQWTSALMRPSGLLTTGPCL